MYNSIAANAQTLNKSYAGAKQTGLWKQFINWAAQQEQKRFLWIAVVYLVQIGAALPCTLVSILYFGGNNFTLWLIACIVNVPSLALNLAAQPTKITLPVLFFAWLVDAGIIVYSLASFFLH